MSEENLTPWQKQHLEYQKKHPELKKEEKKVKPAVKFDENEQEIFVEPEILQPIVPDEIYDDIEEEVEVEPSEPRFQYVGQTFRKMWWLLTIVVLIFLFSIYLITPLSKVGKFTVSGNTHESTISVAENSKITTSDSIFTILRHKKMIENEIASKYVRVANVDLKYQFPNDFKAEITEHKGIMYVTQKNKTYEMLDNGAVLTDTVVKAQAGKPVLDSFSDKEAQEFFTAYESLKPSLSKLITNVTKVPTKATPDFIAINMSDGNQVRVPLSQMAEKLPYYPSVAKQLKAPEVVDMEAGIYAKSQADYQADLDQSSSSVSASISASQAAKLAQATDNTDTADSTTEAQ